MSSSELYNAYEEYTGEVGLPLMADLAADLRNFAANPQQRIPWGIPSLDMYTEGPAAGEVFVILGRSYSGKSLVITNVIANNADKGSLFFSMEMPGRQAVQRLFATWGGIEHSHILEMTDNNTLPSTLDDMAEEMERHVIIERSRLTFGDMSVYVAAYEQTFGERPPFVCLDYLELIDSPGEGWQRTETSARELKAWAKDEHLPVFAVHQMNMSVEPWDPPTQNSARGAGFTEADVVVGIYKPWEDPDLGAAEAKALRYVYHFNVLKNRVSGRAPADAIRCRLTPTLKFNDLSVLDIRGDGS